MLTSASLLIAAAAAQASGDSELPLEVVVAIVALAGTLSGVLVTLIGSWLTAKTAREKRRWDTLWSKKAETYAELLKWAKVDGAPGRSLDDLWVQAGLYGSDRVISVLEAFDSDVAAGVDEAKQRMRKGLLVAVREDLKTARKLPD